MELKVDELLANIRKSVDSDIDNLTNGTASRQRGTLMRGALREMRVSMGAEPEATPSVSSEISDLRARIKQKMAAMDADPFTAAARTVPQQPAKPRAEVVPASRGDFSGILAGQRKPNMALRGSLAETESHEDLRYGFAQTPGWDEREQAQYAEPDPFQQPDHYAQGYGYEQPAYPPQLAGPIMSAQTEAQTETAFRQLSDSLLARATGDRSLEDMTREMLKSMLKQWLDANLPAIVEDMVREEIQRVARRGR